MKKRGTIKTGCKNCKKPTNHKVLYVHSEYPPEEYDYHARTDFMILKCLGCDDISFRSEFHDFESQLYNQFNGEPGYDIRVKSYPKYLDGNVGLADIYDMPPMIKYIYSETLDAVTNENYILSGIGLRAIVEAIVREEDIPGRDLKVKINNLVKNGALSKKDAGRLHAIRFMGNDAAHEMKAYKKDQVLLGLEIIEHILKSLYLFDERSRYLMEMPIDDYDEFEELIGVLTRSNESLKDGNGVTLKSLLGRHLRRIMRDLSEYESALIEKIDSSVLAALTYMKMTVEGKEEYVYRLAT